MKKERKKDKKGTHVFADLPSSNANISANVSETYNRP